MPKPQTSSRYSTKQRGRERRRQARSSSSERSSFTPWYFTTISSNAIGRIVQITDHKGAITYAVHLWERSDQSEFSVGGVYVDRDQAEAEIAGA